MLAQRYLRRRYLEGRAIGIMEGREEAMAEARAKARAEGREKEWEEAKAKSDVEWNAWFARFRQAQEWGEPFDEPSPSERAASDLGATAEVLAVKYLERRYREGRERGRAESDAEWRAWLERSREAEERGEAFDEPPPDERRNGA